MKKRSTDMYYNMYFDLRSGIRGRRGTGRNKAF